MTIPVSRPLDLSEIPIIDLAAAGAVDAIRDACTGVRFFYMVHHDAAGKLVEDLMDQSKLFSSLPQASKQALLPWIP